MIRRPVSVVLRTLPAHSQAQSILRASDRAIARPGPNIPSVSSIWKVQPTSRSLSSSIPRWSTSPEQVDGKVEDPQAQPQPLHDGNAEESTIEEEGQEQDTDGTPWYMQLEPPTPAPRFEPTPLPPLPESPPALLEPIMKFIHEEMGLDELTILDLREFDPPPAPGPNLIMIFGTARSERHLHVSCGRLVRWLRYHYKVDSFADGLIGAAELKTKLRRMRRRAKLLGTSTTSQGADDGIRTGWICVNLNAGVGKKMDEAHHDESGQLSGFGTSSPQADTSTIIVQAMTETRRKELDLETLWRDALAENLKERAMIEEPGTEEEIAALKAAASPAGSARARARQDRVRRHIAQRIQRAGQKAGQRAQKSQARTYSTMRELDSTADARPSAVETEGDKESPLPHTESEDLFADVRARIRQTHVQTLSSEEVHQLYTALLKSVFCEEATEAHAKEQLTLVQDLLRMKDKAAGRRGKVGGGNGEGKSDEDVVISNTTMVPLISAMARAPSTTKSPALQRAQGNLEHLLERSRLPPLPEDMVIELLEAYAVQGNWDRFWYTWRRPVLFMQSRTPRMYAAMFGALASHGKAVNCLDALRDYAAEMEFEEPPVLPVGDVADAMMTLINMVDPRAEADATNLVIWRDEMYKGPPSLKRKARAKSLHVRRYEREFVRMVWKIREIKAAVEYRQMVLEAGTTFQNLDEK